MERKFSISLFGNFWSTSGGYHFSLKFWKFHEFSVPLGIPFQIYGQTLGPSPTPDCRMVDGGVKSLFITVASVFSSDDFAVFFMAFVHGSQ